VPEHLGSSRLNSTANPRKGEKRGSGKFVNLAEVALPCHMVGHFSSRALEERPLHEDAPVGQGLHQQPVPKGLGARAGGQRRPNLSHFAGAQGSRAKPWRAREAAARTELIKTESRTGTLSAASGAFSSPVAMRPLDSVWTSPATALRDPCALEQDFPATLKGTWPGMGRL
jgi:hypothetical protein